MSILFIILSTLFLPAQDNQSFELEAFPIVEVNTEPARKQKLRAQIVAYARAFVGTDYATKKYGKYEFDCSGYVNHIYSKFNIKLARSSSDIAHFNGDKTKYPKPGDLVFFMNKGRINHVAIVTEVDRDGIFIVHSTSSKGVIEENLSLSDYWMERAVFYNEVI